MTTLHWSDLNKMAKSPAHYRYHMDSKGKPGYGEATDAMRFGSLVNHRVFGKTAYPTEFVTWPGGRRAGKEWDAFKILNDGKDIITMSESMMADDAAAALRFHPVAGKLMTLPNIEQRVHWQIGDRPCSGTPDAFGNGVLIDLKVTDPNPDRFMWHAIRMGWLGQLGWYADGIKAAGLDEIRSAHIVAVEPKPPHVVTVFDLTDMALEFGRCQWRGLYERLRACEESNSWPGYCATSTTLDAPDTDSLILNIQGEELEIA